MSISVSGFRLHARLWGKLRECQQKSIETALSYVRRPLDRLNSKSCLISLPTGAGKTGVIALVAHKSTQRRVLILCHRRAVRDQLLKEIDGGFFEARVPGYPDHLKSVYSDVTNTDAPGIYVSTFQKLISFTPQQLATLKDNIDLIIVDEGHSEPSPVWKDLVRGANTHKIVITATPYRNDLFQFDIDERSSYIYTFAEALDQQILMEPIFRTISEDQITNEISEFLENHPSAKCIVKCKEFSDIEHYYNLLNDRFEILAVHEQFVRDGRPNVKVHIPANLRTSQYQIIIHQRKLDEGVDIPEAKLLILTYPVNSGRELVQTIGRVVRLHQGIEPIIIETGVNANQRMWLNYRYFDRSLSNPAAVRTFISSLDVSKLIDIYLQSFPDASYYGNRFLKKFDINDFTPDESLIIPTASICFLNTLTDFNIQAASDLLYWRSNQSGELAKKFDSIGGIKTIISVAFNRSKFLKDQFFFEPSLEVTLFKQLQNNIVAIYDSRGRRFNHDLEMHIGSAVAQDKLLNVMGLGSSTVTKEASSRSVGTTNKRPESISIKGRNLEQLADLQRNSSYRVSNLKCDNLDHLGGKQSSYYIGVDSGRISDQKDGQYTLSELDEWLQHMEATISANNVISSNLLHSFAKPIPVDLSLSIESVFFDLSELPNPIRVIIDGHVTSLDNSFIYLEYRNGFVIDSQHPHLKINISLCDESPFIVINSDHDIVYDVNGDDHQYDDLLPFLLEHLHKILLEKGISYSKGKFYELKLPVENEFRIASSSLANVIIGLPELLDRILDEKGYINEEIQVPNEEFSANSVFHMIDKLKETSLPDPTRSQLGPFATYIPNVDLIFCTDMDTEPADFILSSVNKLVYIHVKCGKAKVRPLSSAGALAEVGGQAIKNIEMLISGNQNLRAANWNSLNASWPTRNAPQQMSERIRLFSNARFSAIDQAEREQKVQEVWELVTQRRQSSRVQKEVWIIAANSFSATHFEAQLNAGHNGSAESLQAYQLVQSWLSTANSNDIELKIFVSP